MAFAFLKKHSRKNAFDELWQALPLYPDSSAPNKEYSRVSQWHGKEMRNLIKIILPVLKVALRQPSTEQCLPFKKVTRCIQNMVHFALMAQYRSHTLKTLQYMDTYFQQFHNSKDIFLEFSGGKVVKRHALQVGTQL